MGVGTILAPISVTDQGHQANEAGQNLTCPHDKVRTAHPFFHSQTFYWPYLDWSNWCETKRKWVNWMIRCLGYLWPWPLTLTFDLEFSRSNCISGLGRGDWAIVMEWNQSTRRCADWVTFDLDLWPWIFQGRIVSREWEARWTKGTGVDRMPWCETQPQGIRQRQPQDSTTIF